MATKNSILAPEWTWTGGRFERDLALTIGADGRIAKIEPRANVTTPMTELANHALLPGFVDAHSHAFQRGLRSTPQRFAPRGATASEINNFWTWRETMYRLAESLDVESFYEICRLCFVEMLEAGVTTVGEFHYLHHDKPTSRWVLDDAVLAAAKDAGIRTVLIQTFYATGGIGKPLLGAQRLFGPQSRQEFVRELDRLASKLDSATQTLAIACHSIRAVELDDLKYFRDYAKRNGDVPFHIHVEEVRGEVRDSLDAYGKTPLRMLLDNIEINERVTAIHCTHSNADDLREYIQRGARVCLCPITEGNLSDGFPDIPTMIESGDGSGKNICVGSDCNIRISFNEELRWLELGQRLRRERRGIVVDRSGNSARALFDIGTINGAEALALKTGAIAVGNLADVIAIDLNHGSMDGVLRPDAILDTFVFGCGNGPIDHVWIGGKLVRPRAKMRRATDKPV